MQKLAQILRQTHGVQLSRAIQSHRRDRDNKPDADFSLQLYVIPLTAPILRVLRLSESVWSSAVELKAARIRNRSTISSGNDHNSKRDLWRWASKPSLCAWNSLKRLSESRVCNVLWDQGVPAIEDFTGVARARVTLPLCAALISRVGERLRCAGSGERGACW